MVLSLSVVIGMQYCILVDNVKWNFKT